jgi:2,5-furandicarboxylate decarboxylase 1
MNLRASIEQARTAGYLVEVDAPTNPKLAMAQVFLRYDGRPILINNVAGYPGWRVLAGLASDREYFARALDVPVEDVIHTLARALESQIPPPIVSTAPCQEVVEPEVDLNRLPILRHLPSDGGPYVTAGILVVNHPDYGRNVSFHRLLRPYGRGRTGHCQHTGSYADCVLQDCPTFRPG